MSKRNQKFTYEEVKEYVESFNYKLLSTEYVRALNKLLFKCPNGHIFERTFAKFKGNKKCPICQGNHVWKYEEVKEYIESFNYELLSTKEEYKTVLDKIKIKCDKGHIYNTNFNNFKNNKRRCGVCANNKTLSYEYVKEYIESFNYKLLSTEYKNANSHLKVQCPEGHEYDVKFGNFKTGYRCPTCSNKITSERQKYTYNYVKDYIESFDYKLISDTYEGVNEYLEITCPEGHHYEVTFDNFKQGNRCPVCLDKSKGENRIVKYLDDNNIEYIHDRRCFKDLLSCKGVPLRPDFILPEYKIWIEFDGVQHYKIINYFGGLDKFITLKIHDTFKNIYAKEHGYKMIRIPYWNMNNIEYILNEELKIS